MIILSRKALLRNYDRHLRVLFMARELFVNLMNQKGLMKKKMFQVNTRSIMGL